MVAVIVAPMLFKHIFKGGVDVEDIYPQEKPPSSPKGASGGPRGGAYQRSGEGREYSTRRADPFKEVHRARQSAMRKDARQQYSKPLGGGTPRPFSAPPKPTISPFESFDWSKPLSFDKDTAAPRGLETGGGARPLGDFVGESSGQKPAGRGEDLDMGSLFGDILGGALKPGLSGSSAEPGAEAARVRESVLDILKAPDSLKAAFVASEILGAPVSLRDGFSTGNANRSVVP